MSYPNKRALLDAVARAHLDRLDEITTAAVTSIIPRPLGEVVDSAITHSQGRFQVLEDAGVHVEGGVLAEYAVDMAVAGDDVAPVQM